jgi:hypothetical protein
MSSRPKIYLDAAPLIDLAKERVGVKLPDNIRQNDVWHLNQFLKAAKDGKVELFTFVLSIAECTHVEDEKNSKRQNQSTWACWRAAGVVSVWCSPPLPLPKEPVICDGFPV